MMWCYGVAYLDKNKKGFTETEPWVLEAVGFIVLVALLIY